MTLDDKTDAERIPVDFKTVEAGETIFYLLTTLRA